MRWSFVALALLLLLSRDAASFTVEPGAILCEPGSGSCTTGEGAVDVEATLALAPRWSGTPVQGRGWHDGIQVAVAPGFAEAFGAVGDAQVDAIHDTLAAAFRSWETPELRFDVTLDGPVAEGVSAGQGFEIDLFAVDGSHPIFGRQFGPGATWYQETFQTTRLLTNGTVLPGLSFLGSEIYLAVDQFEFFFDLLVNIGAGEPDDRLVYLQRTLTHYIGHTIGFGHPDDLPFANFDSDSDPLTPIIIDPLNPFAGLRVSTEIDEDAIMVSEHLNPFAYFITDLRPDDRGGLDVLYPSIVPEPGTALLLIGGLAALGLGRR